MILHRKAKLREYRCEWLAAQISTITNVPCAPQKIKPSKLLTLKASTAVQLLMASFLCQFISN